jgi:outer membrane protein OmpA-like peptidoglycan-associated protein
MNVTSHRIRVLAALPVALLVAALFQLVLIHIATLNIFGGSVFSLFWQTVLQTFGYGLPLGIAAVLATEFLRLRRPDIQIAIGTVLTFIAAHIATRNEPLTSYVFTGGALTPLGLLASGVAASATYWTIAGRRAGWRGDEIESEYERATAAFLRASEQTKIERCLPCLRIWAAASATAFGLFAWLMIDVSGLRYGLLSSFEREGQSALTTSGYAWATFKISDGRGTIEGNAPDELEKRTAYDTAREALNAVTGFPGVLSRIDDKAVAQIPMAAVNQKLADAKFREQQANQAIEEARRVAEAARAAEADAKRMAVENAIASDAERKQWVVQQQENASEQAEVQRYAAEALAKTFDVAPGNAVQHEEVVAAVNVEAPSADQVGARSPKPSSNSETCTDQDVAMVESSHILFEPQTFKIATRFQRELDRVATSVQSCAPRSLLITGYSDANSDRLFNPALGLQRAGAVRDGLVARGISPTHIATKSTPVGFFGETGSSAAEREMFRKTDFEFIEGSELSRDATQRPDERASNCETDLAGIMSQSIIHFSVASARVSEESFGLITKLAGAIQNCGSIIVTVEGHTDKIGTPERNQQLSIARANAVREALVAAGANPTRLASRGFASTRPFATEETAEAFALNRRIEFKVSGKFTSTNSGGP